MAGPPSLDPDLPAQASTTARTTGDPVLVSAATGTTGVQEATAPGLLNDATAIGPSTVWGVGYRFTDALRTLAMRSTNA